MSRSFDGSLPLPFSYTGAASIVPETTGAGDTGRRWPQGPVLASPALSTSRMGILGKVLLYAR